MRLRLPCSSSLSYPQQDYLYPFVHTSRCHVYLRDSRTLVFNSRGILKGINMVVLKPVGNLQYFQNKRECVAAC